MTNSESAVRPDLEVELAEAKRMIEGYKISRHQEALRHSAERRELEARISAIKAEFESELQRMNEEIRVEEKANNSLDTENRRLKKEVIDEKANAERLRGLLERERAQKAGILEAVEIYAGASR